MANRLATKIVAQAVTSARFVANTALEIPIRMIGQKFAARFVFGSQERRTSDSGNPKTKTEEVIGKLPDTDQILNMIRNRTQEDPIALRSPIVLWKCSVRTSTIIMLESLVLLRAMPPAERLSRKYIFQEQIANRFVLANGADIDWWKKSWTFKFNQTSFEMDLVDVKNCILKSDLDSDEGFQLRNKLLERLVDLEDEIPLRLQLENSVIHRLLLKFAEKFY
ncbi:Protein CBG25763 [Caenorhabditis briggsae]|uniref:Protein CBG25763 n=1 Tax=Caenorhabditis briggsae TaxID=6238 RepID=B6ILK1_CAEBR|nr:Protein CBG25763 [Caenorhabditis briggsae]CAS00781.1 Protein CBG25763 [Caenorhabditis briggsae]